MRFILVIISLFLITGCLDKNAKPFEVKNLAKSDIDMVADVNIKEWHKLTKELTIKLYKRNPKELRKVEGMTLSMRLEQLFPTERLPNGFAELNYSDGITAVPLAFSDEFEGDRVFALMAGITGMLHAAYDGKKEIFILDDLDQQKLYNSARNLESIAWHLNNRKDPSGQLYILSNGISPEGISNYSYERILGKLIGIQDLMADIIADKTSRTINRVVQGAASMTFLPI
ncbi:hypothetical protein [Neptuniibacter marinus]|uniref:hypothetical protein n=1 Tax=Neptuniibacter marinus TaxID=1806670 RepID=UPI003B5C3822